MAYRDQPLGELALSILALQLCFVNMIWITAVAVSKAGARGGT